MALAHPKQDMASRLSSKPDEPLKSPTHKHKVAGAHWYATLNREPFAIRETKKNSTPITTPIPEIVEARDSLLCSYEHLLAFQQSGNKTYLEYRQSLHIIVIGVKPYCAFHDPSSFLFVETPIYNPAPGLTKATHDSDCEDWRGPSAENESTTPSMAPVRVRNHMLSPYVVSRVHPLTNTLSLRPGSRKTRWCPIAVLILALFFLPGSSTALDPQRIAGPIRFLGSPFQHLIVDNLVPAEILSVKEEREASLDLGDESNA
ncbi:uncharacterized protein CLUP02_05909 [Colletotrichum lupini]|uniref:Uncharacterized protein n=1 Tax=Colletotrichum lupini TaxID=145971 RepID=A0A9Q8SP94_9PEZI|nr:uncharacterized protein CLUP02_05909 [Colletotrichum lupini]UQC80426.1 hypothetical protein CLUP02_05909 [Colletotrichum lupini]